MNIMPILEINILGSKIEIDYLEDEKSKLLYLVEQLKIRLSEFNNLKDKFSDNKIILLAALKAEDDIYELNRNKKNIQSVSKLYNNEKIKDDKKIKEIIQLKDKISFLEQNNTKLLKQNQDINIEIEKLNVKLKLLINKIINNYIHDS